MSIMKSLQNDFDVLDAVVIGAGWAGLGVSYWLKQKGLRHQVLERGRIGETWRTQRWDTFRMNTPNVQTIMPGDRYDGADPFGALTRNEFVALLEDFARRNALPILPDTAVSDLTQENGLYRLATSNGIVRARTVVVASGSLNIPVRPTWSSALPPVIRQLDASDYRNPSDLPDGAVLVVGGGQSGVQIAEELADHGRSVYLATSRVGRLPRRYRGRDIMVWLVESGFLDVRREEVIRLAGRIPARGILGSLHTISLQSLRAQGVVLLGHCNGIAEDGSLSFADDLEANARFADDASTNAKRFVDDYISRTGINAPAASPDAAETIELRPPYPPIASLDPAQSGIRTLIWCTGFKGDFSWISVPGALDGAGQPLHQDGMASLPGLYFAGLDFASTRKSGIILAIADEAPRLVEHIMTRLAAMVGASA